MMTSAERHLARKAAYVHIRDTIRAMVKRGVRPSDKGLPIAFVVNPDGSSTAAYFAGRPK